MGMVSVAVPPLVSEKLPLIVILDVKVKLTPLFRCNIMFPTKLAAGGQIAPPLLVHAMAEKFLVVVTVEEHV